jgi:alkylated DNA repair protein alkB family protein 6
MPSLNTATLGNTADIGHLPDLGEVKTEPLATVSFSEMEGPWVLIGGPLQGELMVRSDGYCYFRPGDSLGQGIGTITVKSTAAGIATVTIDLEVYRYEQTSRNPPTKPERFTISAVAAKATASAQQYSTLTLNGHLHRDGEHLGQLNAAKMDPWNPSMARVFQPNMEVERGFQALFPNPLRLSQRSRSPLDLEKFRVGDVDSVYYVPDYVTETEERQCLQQLQATPTELKKQLDRRVVQEYGGTMCPECNASFLPDLSQPPWTSEICDALVHDGVFAPTTYPNNVRIHDYAVGHGIAPHVDGPIYVPRVAILSLQSSVVMNFYPYRKPYDDAMEHYNDTFKFDGAIAKDRPHFSLVLEPRSLLVFDNDAYYFHPHGISAKPIDSLRLEDAGPIINRALLRTTPSTATEIVRQPRVGVTIRNLLPRCNHEPERVEAYMQRVWPIAYPTKQPSEPQSKAEKTTKATVPPKPATTGASTQQQPQATSGKYHAMSTPQQSAVAAGAVQPAASPDLSSIHAKLDKIIATQTELQTAVRQMQLLTAHSLSSTSKFQTEVSGVMDHLTTVVMDLQVRAELRDEQDQR